MTTTYQEANAKSSGKKEFFGTRARPELPVDVHGEEGGRRVEDGCLNIKVKVIFKNNSYFRI